MDNPLATVLPHVPEVRVRQKREIAELLGWESRNKYVVEGPDGQPIAWVVENGRSLLRSALRQFFGHWRRFKFEVFDPRKVKRADIEHPFTFLWGRLEVRDVSGVPVGVVQQNFGILTRSIDVLDPSGQTIFEMRAKVWRPWTFPISKAGREVARVEKRWAGVLKEAFTDGDDFRLAFHDPAIGPQERVLLIATALLIDLNWFETKAT